MINLKHFCGQFIVVKGPYTQPMRWFDLGELQVVKNLLNKLSRLSLFHSRRQVLKFNDIGVDIPS